jgi:ketosteroid isomerase-like protein
MADERQLVMITPTRVSPEEAAEFVRGFERHWASPDPTALFDLLHPDVHLVQPLLPEMHSSAAYAEQLRRLLLLVPDLTGRVHRWVPDDNGVIIEHTLGGTVGGKRIELRLCDRITLREGKVVERIAYFDPTPLLLAVLTRPRAWLPYLRMKLGA